MVSIVKLCVIILSVAMLSAAMLSVAMLSVIMLNAAMVNRAMDKLQLAEQNLGQVLTLEVAVYNLLVLPCFETKRPNLKLKNVL
jgi:hypothetical protein